MDAFRGDFAFFMYYFRSVMEHFGESKPLWLTELGWAVTPENHSHVVSFEEQRRFFEYAYRTAMRSGAVERIFAYVLHMKDGMALVHRGDSSETVRPGLGGRPPPPGVRRDQGLHCRPPALVGRRCPAAADAPAGPGVGRTGQRELRPPGRLGPAGQGRPGF